jgi:hypothetical protein
MLLLAPGLAVIVSAAYVKASPQGTAPLKLILTSAHGAVIAALYCGAAIVGLTHHSSAKFGSTFDWLLCVPVILAVTSLILFEGRKSVHVLQVVNLACLGWTAFVGRMTITGQWM